ncbi:hypothetical protein LDENG_00275180, partial [Lucifuga dentata]
MQNGWYGPLTLFLLFYSIILFFNHKVKRKKFVNNTGHDDCQERERERCVQCEP